MTHPTHKTRYSDSSFYDEVCTLCGATDSGELLKVPCVKVDKHANIIEKHRRAKVHIKNALKRVDLESLWLPIEYAEPYKQYLLLWKDDILDLGYRNRALGFYDSNRDAWGQIEKGTNNLFCTYKTAPTHFHEWPE
jgi:hypothetical protein